MFLSSFFSFSLFLFFLGSVLVWFPEVSLVYKTEKKRERRGGSVGWRAEVGTHMWKFTVRATSWNEDVGFGIKTAISWLL